MAEERLVFEVKEARTYMVEGPEGAPKREKPTKDTGYKPVAPEAEGSEGVKDADS